MSFEKGRIAELAGDFPGLSGHLMSIHGRIVDLMRRWKAMDENAARIVAECIREKKACLDLRGCGLAGEVFNTVFSNGAVDGVVFSST
jgi:hypothetical protein